MIKGTIILVGKGADTAAIQADINNKQVILKNSTPFINCITEMNNTQVDNAKELDVVMPIYNLIEHCDNYSRTIGSL